ncbi:hypothetical protein ACA910_003758 [Epithemia clementina (nom. ined.)]
MTTTTTTNLKSNDDPPLTEQTLDLLKELRKAVQQENHDSIVKSIAPALLFQDRLDPNHRASDRAIVMAVADIYVKSLLMQGEFEQVVQLLSQSKQLPSRSNRKPPPQQQQQLQNSKNTVVPPFVAHKLEAARVYAMYRLERYDAARQAAAEAIQLAMTTSTKLQPESGMDDDTLASVPLLQHIQAQAMYHMQDYAGAQAIYEDILRLDKKQQKNDTTGPETLQLLNNVVAISCAHMMPFVRAVDALGTHRPQLSAILKDSLRNSIIQADDEQAVMVADYSSDLAYNMATYDLCTAGHDPTINSMGQTWLQQAIEKCRDSGAAQGLTPEEIAKEVAPMEWHLEWSRLLWQGGTSLSSSSLSSSTTKQASMATRMVALANQALNTATSGSSTSKAASDAVRLLPKPSEKLFVPLQNNLLWYNRAVLLYRADQIEECQKTCEEWAHGIQVVAAKNTKKKKNPPQSLSSSLSSPPPENQNGASKIRVLLSPMESMFWSCRIAVLESLCLAKKTDQKEAALRRLDAQLETLVGAHDKIGEIEDDSGDDIVAHLTLYLQTHRALIENPDGATSDQAIALLKSLPESMQHQKAVIASLASLYHQQGKEEAAQAILKESGNEEALADFMLTQGRYQEVADLCQGRNDEVSKARYVQALSYIDPEKAHLEWSRLEPHLVGMQDDSLTAATGAELELKELPRLTKSNKADSTTASGTAATARNKPQRSHDAVLRRRARKREEYLAHLEEINSPLRSQQPDPERWLPKFERSYNRRRRNRQQQQQHKGAQGGVSERDAAKLDVAARQQARNNSSNNNNEGLGDGERSTAHLAAVSSNGPVRKSGRKRN